MDGISSSDFIGRKAELAVLSESWQAPGGSFIPIYGRRRIGKSELILQFLRTRPGIYHLGKQAPASFQIREFLDESSQILGEPLLARLPAESWRSALEAVESCWKGEGKLVLVFDEYQWTVEACGELSSLLQEFWDRRWRKSGRIMLILCGSFVGFMERDVLGQKSPLYGRRTAQIHLQPFNFREASQFHPSWSHINQARAYFICGGVPLYLRFFYPSRSVEKNIEMNLLSEFAPLFREPEFLLREELRDVHNYHAVLVAIASGNRTIRDIAKAAGVSDKSLHYWLEQLIQLGYVARRLPLSRVRAPARQVHYVLDDPLLRFWFRFVFPHRSQVQRMGPSKAFQELISPEIDAYFGGCFERLCREALPMLYETEGISANYQIGEFWDKQVQIDVVGVRNDGWIDLGECKWGAVGSVPKLISELESKVNLFPNNQADTLGRLIFTRQIPASAFNAKASHPVRWYGLNDLYEKTL